MPSKQLGGGKIDLDLIYPPFLIRYCDVIEACNKRGAVYFLTRGTATYAEQDAIYAQGRTSPGAIVTHARGGFSIHNFGGGGDSTHDRDAKADNGLQPDWQTENYSVLKEEAERHGLVSLGSFKDWPHVQIPGFVTGAEMAPLRDVYEHTPGDVKAKLAAVWAYLDNAKVLG